MTLNEARSVARVDAVGALGFTGAGVTVAVLDSGYDAAHADLDDGPAAEVCFCSVGTGCCPLGGVVQTGTGAADDDNGHGTHVASIITSDGTVSPVGSAPSAEIVAIKVLDSVGHGQESDFWEALEWITTNMPTVGVDIVNMSFRTLGGPYAGNCDNDPTVPNDLVNAINALVSDGVVVVAAAGNDGSSTNLRAPACVGNVISVGAVYDDDVGVGDLGLCTDPTTAQDQITCWSNRGASLDLLAPGAVITAAEAGGTQIEMSGTSMASPLVAGCSALLLEENPTLTPAEIETRLETSETHITDGETMLTYPRLDCLAALDTSSIVDIATAQDFVNLMGNPTNMDGEFRLVADINLNDLNGGSGQVFTQAIVAPDTSSGGAYDGTPFTGRLYGQGFEISNIKIAATGAAAGNDYLGLFGRIGAGARVMNLRLEGVDVELESGSQYVGGLAGYSVDAYIDNVTVSGNRILARGPTNDHLGRLVGFDENGLITDCNVSGSVLGDDNTNFAGGLIGEALRSDIRRSSASGNVRGYISSSYLGGLVGMATETSIQDSFATGRVEGAGATTDGSGYLGALVGAAYDDTVIQLSHATGEVRGNDPGDDLTYVGGLVGYLEDSDIVESYSTSSLNVPDSHLVGGLAGYMTNLATISRSYYDGTLDGGNDVGGLTGMAFVDCSIADSYSAGSVSGVSGVVGGIAGQIQADSSITNSFSVATVSGPAGSDTGGLVGYVTIRSVVSNSYFLDTQGPDNGYGIPLTAAQMNDISNYQGWDFVDTWYPPVNGHPNLRWATSEICGDGVVQGSEECDDGGTSNGDCCSSTCQYEVAGSSCADVDMCNGGEVCDGRDMPGRVPS